VHQTDPKTLKKIEIFKNTGWIVFSNGPFKPRPIVSRAAQINMARVRAVIDIVIDYGKISREMFII